MMLLTMRQCHGIMAVTPAECCVRACALLALFAAFCWWETFFSRFECNAHLYVQLQMSALLAISRPVPAASAHMLVPL